MTETPDHVDAVGHSAALQFRVGHSCRRLLVWDCQIIDKPAVSALAERLVRLGYTQSSHSHLVQELAHPDEHTVIIVPRTARVQIRVHYLTPLAERAAAAALVASDIRSCIDGP